MNLKNKQYWLFDMDGTLTCAMHDFDAIRAELELPVGVPILEALAAMEPEQARMKKAELDELELALAENATSQPGSHELLDQLESKGAKLGIVTRNGKQIAKRTLEACGLSKYFAEEDVISRDCCTAKPDPAGVLLLLSRWSASSESAIMVGDYLFDLQAGFSAGIETVHLNVDGGTTWPDVTSISVDSLQELTQLAV